MTSTFVMAILIGAGILVLTLWSIRFIATGPPPEPDPDSMVAVDVPYLCVVCGMSLTVTEAQGDNIDPPRHCREDMMKA